MSAASARTNLGLGTAATHAATDFNKVKLNTYGPEAALIIAAGTNVAVAASTVAGTSVTVTVAAFSSLDAYADSLAANSFGGYTPGIAIVGTNGITSTVSTAGSPANYAEWHISGAAFMLGSNNLSEVTVQSSARSNINAAEAGIGAAGTITLFGPSTNGSITVNGDGQITAYLDPS